MSDLEFLARRMRRLEAKYDLILCLLCSIWIGIFWLLLPAGVLPWLK